MKKILTVYTGGTICSAPDGECRSLNPELAKRAIAANFAESDSIFAPMAGDLFFDSQLEEKRQTLSENMTIEKLNHIISHIKSLDLSQFGGVIVLHGTDTLAYTAAIFSVIFSQIPIPLMLVSGNRPPMDELSNANANFRAATELICKGIAPNIYIPYGNSDGKIYLHLGSDIMQSENFSEDFRSASKEKCFDLSEEKDIFETAQRLSENRQALPKEITELKKGVLLLKPYAGMDYSAISLNGIKAIAHGSYHSGTICVERNGVDEDFSSSSVLFLAEKAKEAKIPLFFAPCLLDSHQYSSAFDAASNGCIPINCTTELLYAKLLAAVSIGLTDEDLKSFVLTHQ